MEWLYSDFSQPAAYPTGSYMPAPASEPMPVEPWPWLPQPVPWPNIAMGDPNIWLGVPITLF
jgi:hypothetical protein